MGQSQVGRANGAVDTVITNALIVDRLVLIKLILALRMVFFRIGVQPDTQPNVDIIVGPAPKL